MIFDFKLINYIINIYILYIYYKINYFFILQSRFKNHNKVTF